MRMEHGWSLICARPITDQQSGNISLIDVIEQLNLDSDTVNSNKTRNLSISMFVVSGWRAVASGPRTTCRYEFIGPDKKRLSVMDLELKDVKLGHRLRSVTEMEDMIVNVPGYHIIQVSIKKTEKKPYDIVARIPLEIRFLDIDE